MLSTRMKIIGATLETTAGTPITIENPTWYGYDSDIVNNVAFTPHAAAGTLSQRPAQAGVESGQHTFKTELVKNAPWAATLMPALGFVATGSAWSPSDDPDDWGWVTTGENIAGKRKKISGAMGSAVISLIAGQVPEVAWTFTGRYDAEADATQFTAPSIAVQNAGLPHGGATVTLGGAATCYANATLSINNTVSLILCANKVGGIYLAWIEDREIQLVIDPFEELAATRNDDGIQRAKTLQAFSAAWGDMSISMPKCQLRQIANGERNGLSARALTFIGTMNAAAGDELVIDFDTSA